MAYDGAFAKRFFGVFLVMVGFDTAAETIPNGGSVSGTIFPAGETDIHSFEGVAGVSGVVSISGDIPNGEFWRVFNPDGSQLAQNYNYGRITLPQTGSYRVEVESFSSGWTGSYTFHLALAGANEHGLISNGAAVAQRIDDDGEIDSFSFEVATAGSGLISIGGDISTGEYLYVFNPDGSYLAEGWGSRRLTLDQSGTYTVVTRSGQFFGQGDYEVHLALPENTREFGNIANGLTVEQTLNGFGDIDSFTITGFEGATATITLGGTVPGGEYMYVFTPDGQYFGENTDDITINSMSAGNYTVAVTAWQTPDAVGDYTLSLSVNCATSLDSDNDSQPDACDNCIAISNADQRDTDADGYGNACDADLNNDCVTNFLDLAVMKSAFFTSQPNPDLNGDGSVNFVDLSVLRAGFFLPPGPSASGQCP